MTSLGDLPKVKNLKVFGSSSLRTTFGFSGERTFKYQFESKMFLDLISTEKHNNCSNKSWRNGCVYNAQPFWCVVICEEARLRFWEWWDTPRAAKVNRLNYRAQAKTTKGARRWFKWAQERSIAVNKKYLLSGIELNKLNIDDQRDLSFTRRLS